MTPRFGSNSSYFPLKNHHWRRALIDDGWWESERSQVVIVDPGSVESSVSIREQRFGGAEAGERPSQL